MSELIEAVIKTRELAADIFAKSLINVDGISEKGITEKILFEIKNHTEVFKEGWYSPPPGGVSVLLDQKPFKRLDFETIRLQSNWPNETHFSKKESVGILYSSLVDKNTGMIGDIAFTIYNGHDKEIKEHVKICFEIILKIAQKAKVGMKFSDLYDFGMELIEENNKRKGGIKGTSALGINSVFGHTIPGSNTGGLNTIGDFEGIKQTIAKNRIYIDSSEDFKIPDTCAFSVETKIGDFKKPELPTVFFHFIVCFDNGKKTILENFDEIFKVVGMDYMKSNY